MCREILLIEPTFMSLATTLMELTFMNLATTHARFIFGAKVATAQPNCSTGTCDRCGIYITAAACIVDTPLSAHSELSYLRDAKFLVCLGLLRRQYKGKLELLKGENVFQTKTWTNK